MESRRRSTLRRKLKSSQRLIDEGFGDPVWSLFLISCISLPFRVFRVFRGSYIFNSSWSIFGLVRGFPSISVVHLVVLISFAIMVSSAWPRGSRRMMVPSGSIR